MKEEEVRLGRQAKFVLILGSEASDETHFYSVRSDDMALFE